METPLLLDLTFLFVSVVKLLLVGTQTWVHTMAAESATFPEDWRQVGRFDRVIQI